MLAKKIMELVNRDIDVIIDLSGITEKLNKSFKEFLIAIKVLDSNGKFLGECNLGLSVTLFPSVLVQDGFPSRFSLSSLEKAGEYDINLNESLETTVYHTVSMYEWNNDDEFWLSFPRNVKFLPSMSNGITKVRDESSLHFSIRRALELKDIEVVKAALNLFKSIIFFSNKVEELMMHYQRHDVSNGSLVANGSSQGFLLERIAHKRLIQRCYFWVNFLEGDFVKENVLCLDN